MKNQRLKQFAASLLVVLSLFASSVSACACAHHRQQTKTVSSSCHEHSPGAETHQRPILPETEQTLVSETACCCVQPAPRVFAKAKNVKTEKQILVSREIPQVKIAFVAQRIPVESEFVAPFYLTDSFYNLAPGRAPPRL